MGNNYLDYANTQIRDASRWLKNYQATKAAGNSTGGTTDTGNTGGTGSTNPNTAMLQMLQQMMVQMTQLLDLLIQKTTGTQQQQDPMQQMMLQMMQLMETLMTTQASSTANTSSTSTTNNTDTSQQLMMQMMQMMLVLMQSILQMSPTAYNNALTTPSTGMSSTSTTGSGGNTASTGSTSTTGNTTTTNTTPTTSTTTGTTATDTSTTNTGTTTTGTTTTGTATDTATTSDQQALNAMLTYLAKDPNAAGTLDAMVEDWSNKGFSDAQFGKSLMYLLHQGGDDVQTALSSWLPVLFKNQMLNPTPFLKADYLSLLTMDQASKLSAAVAEAGLTDTDGQLQETLASALVTNALNSKTDNDTLREKVVAQDVMYKLLQDSPTDTNVQNLLKQAGFTQNASGQWQGPFTLQPQFDTTTTAQTV